MCQIKCRSFDEIMEQYHRKSRLTKYAVQKLSTEMADKLQYLAGETLSCDGCFENDDGSYLYADRNDADEFVLIATSGQGDEWLLRLSDKCVYFLDHNIWDEPEAVSPMEISFEQFVIMADVLGQFEKRMPLPKNIELLKQQFDSIHHNLVENFPFNFE